MSSDPDLIVVALSGEGALALCDLDGATGVMTLRTKVPLPGIDGSCGGMPLAANAAGDRIYAAWRGTEKRLFTFELHAASRRLTTLSTVPLPASMCFVSLIAEGRRLATASMTDSRIALGAIEPDGTGGPSIWTDVAPYPHCLVEAPNGLIYSPSLKDHFIQIYELAGDASALRTVARCDMPVDSGPRHIRFTADGTTAYLLSEFAGTLTAFTVETDGMLTPRQTTALLADGEKAWASEILLSAEERTLYASERNSSQIFAFRLENGEMYKIGATPAPTCPRAFGFDAEGKHLIALGEVSGEAWSYSIGPDGVLSRVDVIDIGSSPSWMLSFPGRDL